MGGFRNRQPAGCLIAKSEWHVGAVEARGMGQRAQSSPEQGLFGSGWSFEARASGVGEVRALRGKFFGTGGS